MSVLLAHIIATRCRGDIITDADMAYPQEWRSQAGRAAGQDVGHQEGGRTVGLHSLAVLPRLHRCGIGQTIMKAYLDQMKCCGLVDRVALICQDVSSSSAPLCIWREGWTREQRGTVVVNQGCDSILCPTINDLGLSISGRARRSLGEAGGMTW